MEKLKKEYKEKYEILSGKADKFWRTSAIIVCLVFIVIFFFISSWKIKMIALLFFLGTMFCLKCICLRMYNHELFKKITKLPSISKTNDSQNYENALDEYQKRCVSNYIRKNKLNKLGKLNIMINSLQEEINGKWYNKYKELFVIPSILEFGTLVINYDETVNLGDYFFQYVITIGACVAIIINFYKIYDCKEFNKYIGLERLKELLEHVALKHGR